jgi:hypothetical protein
VLLGQVDQPGDRDQREPIGDPEDRPAPSGQAEGGGGTAEALFQVVAFRRSQDHAQRRLAASHRCLLELGNQGKQAGIMTENGVEGNSRPYFL